MQNILGTFAGWARHEGLRWHGIEVADIPGHGLGVRATRSIKAGTELLTVPAGAILHPDRLPVDFRRRVRPSVPTVHGLLAEFLTAGPTAERVRRGLQTDGEWAALWPSPFDLAATLPLLLPPAVRRAAMADPVKFRLLPWSIVGRGGTKAGAETEATALLALQEARFERDWAACAGTAQAVDSADGDVLIKERFRYYWLLVNSRTFYCDDGSLAGIKDKAQRMVMCPFVELFNHADQGCKVEYSGSFVVTADRDYEKGEELFVSYGSHSNDVLWTEYGFLLRGNSCDSVNVDWAVEQNIIRGSKVALERLETAGFLGKYVLGDDGLCYRTIAAIRSIRLNSPDWDAFLRGKESEFKRKKEDAAAATIIRQKILEPCAEEAAQALEWLEDSSKVPNTIPQSFLKMSKQRWKQIASIINKAMQSSS